jgi:DNA-nicking Smr family endonuclease
MTENQKLTEKDQQIWNDYIKSVMHKPETSFVPTKGRDTTLRMKLDLHSCTIQQAFNKTRQFLEDHHLFKTRSVVIVTGKSGKIAEELPLWCENLGFVRSCVPILDKNGGHGAYQISFFKHP